MEWVHLQIKLPLALGFNSVFKSPLWDYWFVPYLGGPLSFSESCSTLNK